MTTSRLETKVGIFVLSGMVLLGLLLLQFSKGLSLFQSTYQIRLYSASVGGLKEKAAVTISGVQIGSVKEIRLAADGKRVALALEIYRRFEVYKDARFVLEQSGFLGDQYVSILPTENKGEKFKDGDEAVAEPPFNLQEVARAATGIVKRVENTTRHLDETMGDLRQTVLSEQTLTNLATTAANLRIVSEQAVTTVTNASALVDGNRPGVTQTISNLVFFSERMNQLAANLDRVVQTNSPGVSAIVNNLEASSAALKGVVSDLEAGKGLAGNLLRNEQMAKDVEKISANLRVTTTTLNDRGLWGLLWAPRPPRTNAPSQPAERLASPKAGD
jgi:phospholipid/cholesterol/gamma-HCH transport system substrate-binding protein